MNTNNSHAQPRTGDILVSQPMLNDNFFKQSIVMLANHDEEGSFGFILNKPANIKLSDLNVGFPNFDADLYVGGPVQMRSLFFVHSKGDLVADSLKVTDGVYWGGNIDQVKQMILQGEIAPNEIRFYIGYAGWQSGQLLSELAENSWIVLNARKQHVFGETHRNVWKNLVLSLGSEYADWINFPVDPNLN